MKTVKGKINIEGIKRCYMEGAIIEAPCPNCGTILKRDLTSDYLSYPVIGKETDHYLYCSTCENAGKTDFEFSIKIKITEASAIIEYDPDSIESL